MTHPEPPGPAEGRRESGPGSGSDTPTEPARPEDEDSVRRLLAEAGGPVATPPEVRVRLDRTLAGLVATRAGPATAEPPTAPADSERPRATVTDLAAAGRRRRRRWPALAVAAASVFVLGYGLSAVVQGAREGAGSDESAADAGGQAAGAGTEDVARGAAGDAGGGGAVPAPSRRVQGSLPGLADVPDVTAVFLGYRGAKFSWDAELGAALGPWALVSDGVAVAPSPGPGLVIACADPPTAADDEAYRVRFRGRPATMVLGPPDQRRRLAVVYGCATARPLDAAVLRAE